MDMKLRGKRALVTGSSAGIGAGIARMLAGEGVEVIVHGRSHVRAEKVAEEIRATGGHALAVTGDLEQDDDAAAVAQAAIDTLGALFVSHQPSR